MGQRPRLIWREANAPIRWLALGLVLLAVGCGTTGESTSDAVCPRLPEVTADRYTSILWPSEDAANLVPTFTDVCATPTAPHLFYVLNENAYWASDLESAAFGILHRDDQELATFSVVRVGDATKLDKGVSDQEVTTRVGGLTLAWGGAGDHVVVAWYSANDIVNLSAEGADAAASAAEAWLSASGHEGKVVPPEQIPEVGDMPLALSVGPPLDNLPEGYSALVVDPLAFLASDFADIVTIHEEKSVEALGAAIIVSEKGAVVGTVVAGLGGRQGLAEYAQDFEGVSGVVGEGFTASETDVLVVGYDREEVTAFTAAWEETVAN